MKRVLILDGSIYPEMYGPTAEWRALLGAVPSDSVHLPSGEEAPDLGGYSHLILTGSEASIVRPEPWYEVEAAAVRRAFELGLPILGSCFGHQMLARALSGAEHVGASSTPEIGWIEVEITGNDPLLEGVPRPWRVFASHFDEVPAPPAPWRVLARSPRCAVHVMRFGDRPIWGIQAHPEIPPDHARALMEGFVERVPDKANLIRPALSETPRDDGVGGILVRRFLDAT